MNNNILINFLNKEYKVKVLEVVDDNIILKTNLINLQNVVTELYTSDFTELHITIISADNVQIRTESIDY